MTTDERPFEQLGRLIDRHKCRGVEDAERFKALDWDECQLCGAHGEDKRTLRLACFYSVDEVVPEVIRLDQVEDEHFRGDGYFLRICKSCRGDFLDSLGKWRGRRVALRGVPKDHDGRPTEDDDPERCIPVRINGAISMLTRQEWDEHERSKRKGEDIS